MSIEKSIRVGIMSEEGSQRRGRPMANYGLVRHLTLDIGLGDASAPGRVTRGRTENIVAE